jgi:hypothetical protein
MADTSPSLDLLCELSAHERRLAENPDAHGYLKLASGYAEAGWIKEATRAAQRAKALAQGTEGERTDVAVLTGPCTPKILLEIVRAMTLTGKSGHLQLDAPGGIRVSLALADGQLIGAQSSDTAPGEAALLRAASLRACRYAFVPGPVAADIPTLDAPTDELLALMAARVAG